MMSGTHEPELEASELLSIGEIARRTGVSSATLRTWETRYGVLDPVRLASGHRRYNEHDVDLVMEVLRRRRAGQNMSSAVETAKAAMAAVEPSVFAGLRRRHPQLRSHRLRKPQLLALTRAIEDECCARAAHPALFGCFQDQRFYEQSRLRWEDLARTARSAVALAAFDQSPAAEGDIVTISLPSDAVMRREWVLVCDAADHPGCVAGWELPGQGDLPDSRRVFETVWTVEPHLVRDAALICATLASALAPETGDHGAALEQAPPEASPDLRRAQSVFDRLLSYLGNDDRAVQR